MIKKLFFKKLDQYLNQWLSDTPEPLVEEYKENKLLRAVHKAMGVMPYACSEEVEDFSGDFCAAEKPSGISLEEALALEDESFSDSVFRIIREKDLNETDVYKTAGIDRRLFSKIRSDSDYRPSKNTVLALAVALQLDIDETEELLNKAGFALSYSNKADLIVRFFIEQEVFDLSLIDEALLRYDQKTLIHY